MAGLVVLINYNFIHFRCWLTSNAFYGAFLAPVSLILIWNIISFVSVTRVMWGSTKPKTLVKSVHGDISDRIRRIFSVVVLFGLTWTFAIFAINGGGTVFQYLFCIFNSLQGFFIFIFYCALHKELKTFWMRTITCRKETEQSSQSSRGEN